MKSKLIFVALKYSNHNITAITNKQKKDIQNKMLHHITKYKEYKYTKTIVAHTSYQKDSFNRVIPEDINHLWARKSAKVAPCTSALIVTTHIHHREGVIHR